MTIAKVLLRGEARVGYVPSEQVVTYREMVRLHMPLSDEAAAYQNEMGDPGDRTLRLSFSRSLLIPVGRRLSPYSKRFPALRLWPRGVEPLFQLLRAQKPAHDGRPTAQKLVALAKASGSSGRALVGRSLSLRILCDQWEHTQANLARLEIEMEELLASDPGVKGLQQVPGCEPQDRGRAAR